MGQYRSDSFNVDYSFLGSHQNRLFIHRGSQCASDLRPGTLPALTKLYIWWHAGLFPRSNTSYGSLTVCELYLNWKFLRSWNPCCMCSGHKSGTRCPRSWSRVWGGHFNTMHSLCIDLSQDRLVRDRRLVRNRHAKFKERRIALKENCKFILA